MPDRRLDLLLIHSSSGAIYQGLHSKYSAIEPPVWALLLAESCRSKGFVVAILDCDAERLTDAQTASRVADVDPRLVVFVVMGSEPNQSTVRMEGAVSACRELKRCFPEYKTCFVGNHVSALPMETLKEWSVDFVLLNEGVYALHSLLDAYANGVGIDCAKIKGIGWKETDGTAHLNNPEKIVPQDRMDIDLPGYAWDLLPYNSKPLDLYRSHFWHGTFDHAKRSPFAAMYSSLGCRFKCLAGATPVNTIYGEIPIKELAEKYKTVPVYTYDVGTKRLLIADATNITKTGMQQELVRVRFTDGTCIDCTPDHKFLRIGGGNKYKKFQEVPTEAVNLLPKMRVRAYNEYCYDGKYRQVYCANDAYYNGRLVLEYKLGRPLIGEEEVHHIDGNKTNDVPENLVCYASHKDHLKCAHADYDPQLHWGPEVRKEISKKAKAYRNRPEVREKYREANLGTNNPNYKHGKRCGTRSKIGGSNHVIVSVERLPELGDVYCMEVRGFGWFFANHVLVKNCSYCMINSINRITNDPNYTAADSNVMRWWSAEKTLSRFDQLVEMGCTTIRISDEMFFLDRRHFEPIIDGLAAKDYAKDLNLWAYARIDSVRPRYLDRFRKAGIRWLCLGIESSSQKIRREVSKGTFEEVDIRDVVRQVHDAGIEVIANYIFGLPTDTKESMQETLALAVELNTSMFNMYPCFVPGSMVYTPTGCKPIEDIKQGDVVNSSIGTSVVTATMKRNFTGKIKYVKARYLPPIRVTSEHPIFIAEIQRGTKRRNRNKAEIIGTKFVDAGDLVPFNLSDLTAVYHAVVLKKKHLVGRDTTINFSQFVNGQVGGRGKGKGRGGHLGPFGRRYLQDWPVTEEMAELFGWYVAEGSLGSHHYPRVVFSLGYDEDAEADRICYLVDSVFGLKAKKKLRGSVLRVGLQSKVLHRAVHDLFGKDCYSKRVPICILESRPSVTKAFLRAYQAGDGTSRPNKKGQHHVDTASRTLAYQLFMLYAKIGTVVGYSEQLPEPSLALKRINGRWTTTNIQYRLSWVIGNGARNYLEDEENYYFPIKSVESECWEGMVHNLETTDNTYCVPYIVHNCMALPGSPLYAEAKKNGVKIPDSYAGFGFLSFECQPLPTATLSAADVLMARDEAFQAYWNRPEFLAMLERKFGAQSRAYVEEMLKIKLKRKLLGD